MFIDTNVLVSARFFNTRDFRRFGGRIELVDRYGL